ncbi:MAG: 16S rRNA (guanine(966)-N(2))-methyltransferase RsmD [Clostridia bacterium]|nr:16S rRNA (guanine(966)-N(2))-methyltransferase RsmD [Clostridia bacterium]
MRIIAGEARGRRLLSPAGNDTRPTSDRVRESVFNIIGRAIADACVADLFGGTGAMALEALSRGASKALISDCSEQAVRIIRKNALLVLGEEGISRATILKTDYRSAIARMQRDTYSFVFLDPPYRMKEAYASALDLMAAGGCLKDGWTAVLEREADERIELPDVYEVYDSRRYGRAAVDFVRRSPS